jgi:NAD(P)-dependent dehydrogenase (short-subunit alcohol dehydrogenase family)
MNTVTQSTNYGGLMQTPLHSGFNARSTAGDVISGTDLSGKVAIVTGGNTGIGLETTKALAAAGATVVIPARDVAKARKNLAGISNVEIAAMDLTDPDSIDRFAAGFLATGRALHLLINNAGIMWVPLRRDDRGIESQFATNYVGQFYLTARLWSALKKAKGARVVNVSSQGHQFGSINFNDLNYNNREYDTLQAYGQSKTAINLFTVELDHRGRESNIRAYSLHPGSIHGTELAREASPELFQKMGFYDNDGKIRPEVLASLKTIPQGAATTVWCATSPLLQGVGGVYCEDCDIAEVSTGAVGSPGVRAYSLNGDSARRLWTLTEDMTGIEFNTK